MTNLTIDDLAILKQPFTVDEHEFHPYTKNVYIREWAVCDRIEMVDPAWAFERLSLDTRQSDGEKDKTIVVATFRMTIKGVSRDGIGMADVNTTKDNSDEANEAEKSAATDALKRCARLFGVGRYLLTVPKAVRDERSLEQWLNGGKSTPPPTQNAKKNTGIATASFVKVLTTKSGDPYYVAEGDVYSFTRQPYRDAGLIVDHWTEAGKQYSFARKLSLAWETNDKGNKVLTRVEPVQQEEPAS